MFKKAALDSFYIFNSEIDTFKSLYKTRRNRQLTHFYDSCLLELEMCIETMDTRSKHVRKTDCLLRKTVKPGSKLMRTIRKYLRREEKQRRSQLAKLTRALMVVGDIEKKKKKKKKESVWCEEEERRNHAATPSGAMAPQNTTQYLMGNVYEDMTTHVSAAHLYSESPAVCAPLDSDYDSCLAFQQRDFEEVFNLSW